MPLYTFYPRKAAGASETFETVDLPGDAEAFSAALLALKRYDSATDIEVWCGERHVLSWARLGTDLQGMRLRPSAHAG
jgi:hypothetical protein